MAYDDFEDRRQQSNNYLNRRDDQLDFERKQAEQSKTVYDAILNKNHSRAYAELGIPAPDPSDVDSEYSDTSQESNRQPSAQEQFAEHSARLIANLRLSSALPAHITQEWIGKIEQITILLPTIGLRILNGIMEDYLQALDEYKPQRDIFNLAISETMQFDEDMRDIKLELDWLEAILKHVEDYMKQNPFK